MDFGEVFETIHPNRQMAKILVREEYEKVEKTIEDFRGMELGGLVITGQPGTGTACSNVTCRSLFTFSYIAGKTFCLIYLLVNRLLDKNPTFFQMSAGLTYLFCEQGVFVLNSNNINRLFIPYGLENACESLGVDLNFANGPLLLIDSNVSLTSIPDFFYDGQVDVFIVQAAASTPRSSFSWVRRSNALYYDMKPWTRSEILAG